MTSCLSDMRTVRPQGPTFRITQPYGLRVSVFKNASEHSQGLKLHLYRNKNELGILNRDLNSRHGIVLYLQHPQLRQYGKRDLSESCPKIEDVPKPSFPQLAALVSSAGTILI